MVWLCILPCFQFAEYFKFYQFHQWVSAPIVKIDKKSLYTVKEFYLDDCNKDMVRKPEDLHRPGISDEMYKLAVMLISNMKTIDKNNENGSILVFLPGIYEIGILRTLLMEHREA